MKIIIAGGTGFIGAAAAGRLARSGHEVVILSRQPSRRGAPYRQEPWDGLHAQSCARALEGADAIVNLAGAPVAQGRWGAARKMDLIASRIGATRALVEAIRRASRGPAVLVNASAVGYYGDRGDEFLYEESPPGQGFLCDLALAWEAAASEASALGVRVVKLRIGMVLHREGGALARMIPVFRAFLGGPLGTGRQWVSWIAREDLAALIAHAVENPIEGAVNAAAPDPATNAEFAGAVARALGRPCRLGAPAAALRIAFGEMADEILLASQRVFPRKALGSGFSFRYRDLDAALKAALE